MYGNRLSFFITSWPQRNYRSWNRTRSKAHNAQKGSLDVLGKMRVNYPVTKHERMTAQPTIWLTVHDCLTVTIYGSKCTYDIASLHSQQHHGLTDKRPIIWRLNWPIGSITRVKNHQRTWYNSLWLWRWLPYRLSKCQSLSTGVLFRTTFTRMIKLNLLMKWLLVSNLSQTNT